MPRMRSLIPHHYNGKKQPPDSEYDASILDARVLVGLGRARVLDEKSLQAEKPATGERRTYKRRDISTQQSEK